MQAVIGSYSKKRKAIRTGYSKKEKSHTNGLFNKREKPYERAILKENSHNDERLPKEWHTPSNS